LQVLRKTSINENYDLRKLWLPIPNRREQQMKTYEWVNKKPEFQYRWTKEKGWTQKPQKEYWQLQEIKQSEKDTTK
jgi:hypothetical protein